jgi:hypothetical protein
MDGLSGSPTAADVAEPIVTTGQVGLPLVRLDARACRFPVGVSEADGRHLFCGERCPPSRSFCSAHHALAYEPIRPRGSASAQAVESPQRRSGQWTRATLE